MPATTVFSQPTRQDDYEDALSQLGDMVRCAGKKHSVTVGQRASATAAESRR
jgi:hypothetical protein